MRSHVLRSSLVPLALTRRSNPAHAFTLIEVLLVIGIIAILVALALPRLAQTRASARSAVGLSRLQQHGQVHALYAVDFRDSAVYPVDPRRPEDARFVSQALTVHSMYFSTKFFWNIALADGYYQGQVRGDIFDSPYRTPADGASGFTDFHYSSVFLAHPDFWTIGRRVGPSQWQATRLDQVRFPASKALLCYRPQPNYADWSFTNWSGSMGLVDGSARRTPVVLPGFPDGDGNWPGCMSGGGALQTMHTLEGVLGRDTPP